MTPAASEILRAIILGIMQGATEFLPVSSSGHLILVPALLGWPPASLTFDVAVHWATALAVLLHFRHDWARLLSGSWRDLRCRALRSSVEARLLLLLALATIPAVIAGLLLEAPFERILATDALAMARATAALLLLTGAVLLVAEYVGSRDRPAERLSMAGAAAVGVAQAAAILPGLSRSGLTMAAGLWAGLARPEAARFSFLLAAPIILGAGLVEAADASLVALPPTERAAMAAGFVSAFLTGYLAISWLLRFLRRAPLTWFVAYTWLLGALALWLLR